MGSVADRPFPLSILLEEFPHPREELQVFQGKAGENGEKDIDLLFCPEPLVNEEQVLITESAQSAPAPGKLLVNHLNAELRRGRLELHEEPCPPHWRFPRGDCGFLRIPLRFF